MKLPTAKEFEIASLIKDMVLDYRASAHAATNYVLTEECHPNRKLRLGVTSTQNAVQAAEIRLRLRDFCEGQGLDIREVDAQLLHELN